MGGRLFFSSAKGQPMHTIYRNTERGLETMSEFVNNCWVCVIDPTPEEVNHLGSELKIPCDFLTYPLDLDERSRTEKEDGVTLVILRVPHFQGEKVDIPYMTLPLGIILTEKCVVTVCKTQVGVLEELNLRKGLSTAKRNRFVLQVFLLTANKYLSYLRQINKIVDHLEDQLQKSQRNREVLELLKYEKSLVYFTTGLRSNELMMERLQKSQIFRMYPDDEDLLEDVLTENQQAIEMVGIANNILSGMMDAFASIISNNLNAVMKFLASITIIMAIPTMVASFYGMNVDLPMERSPHAFAFVFSLCAFLVVSMIVLFWKKDWF
jgi:magnesium transporter